MGASSSDQNMQEDYEETILQYKLLEAFQNQSLGDGSLYVHKENPNKFAIQRKFLTNNEEQFEQYLNQAKFRKDMRHKNICRTLAYGEEKDNGFCSTNFVLKVLIEHSNYSLLTEVEKRKSLNQQFTEREIYLIIYEVISGLNYYTQFAIPHQNIRLDSILMCRSEEEISHIFQDQNQNYDTSIINDTDFYAKLQDPIIFSPQTNYNLACINLPSAHTFNYLSPILTEAISRSDPHPVHNYQKSDIFSLGMCMLQVCLLIDNNDCYDYSSGKFFEDALLAKIRKMRNYYSTELSDLIESMLITNEDLRPTPGDYILLLKQKEHYFARENLSGKNSPQQNSPQDFIQPDSYILHQSRQQQQPLQQSFQRASPPPQQVNEVRNNNVFQREQEDPGSRNDFRPQLNQLRSNPDDIGDHQTEQYVPGRESPNRKENTNLHTFQPVTHEVTNLEHRKHHNRERKPLEQPRQYHQEPDSPLHKISNINNYSQPQPVTVTNNIVPSTTTLTNNIKTFNSQPQPLNESRQQTVIKLDDPRNPYFNQAKQMAQPIHQASTSDLLQSAQPKTVTRPSTYESNVVPSSVETVKRAHHTRPNAPTTTTSYQSPTTTTNYQPATTTTNYQPATTTINYQPATTTNYQPLNSTPSSRVIRQEPATSYVQPQTYQPAESVSYKPTVSNIPAPLIDSGIYKLPGDNKSIEKYDDGSRYEGEMALGARNGYGVFHYPNGGRYEGYWRQDKMDGKGRIYGTQGQLHYDGDFKDDKFNGIGIVYNTEPSGYTPSQINYQNLNSESNWNRFEGTFVYDKKEGWGTIYFQGGSRFEGQFVDDKANGFGTYINSAGQEQARGRWDNGVYASEF